MAAPVQDAYTEGSDFSSAGTQTVSHAAGSNASAALVMVVSNSSTGASKVSYGGAFLLPIDSGWSGVRYIQYFYGADLPGGTQDVVMYTPDSTTRRMHIVSIRTSGGSAPYIYPGQEVNYNGATPLNGYYSYTASSGTTFLTQPTDVLMFVALNKNTGTIETPGNGLTLLGGSGTGVGFAAQSLSYSTTDPVKWNDSGAASAQMSWISIVEKSTLEIHSASDGLTGSGGTISDISMGFLPGPIALLVVHYWEAGVTTSGITSVTWGPFAFTKVATAVDTTANGTITIWTLTDEQADFTNIAYDDADITATGGTVTIFALYAYASWYGTSATFTTFTPSSSSSATTTSTNWNLSSGRKFDVGADFFTGNNATSEVTAKSGNILSPYNGNGSLTYGQVHPFFLSGPYAISGWDSRIWGDPADNTAGGFTMSPASSYVLLSWQLDTAGTLIQSRRARTRVSPVASAEGAVSSFPTVTNVGTYDGGTGDAVPTWTSNTGDLVVILTETLNGETPTVPGFTRHPSTPVVSTDTELNVFYRRNSGAFPDAMDFSGSSTSTNFGLATRMLATDGTYVAYVHNGIIYYSTNPNLNSWSTVSSATTGLNTTNGFGNIYYIDGKWIANGWQTSSAAATAAYATSLTGSWTSFTINGYYYGHNLVYDGTRWVWIGSSGVAYSSTLGGTLTYRTAQDICGGSVAMQIRDANWNGSYWGIRAQDGADTSQPWHYMTNITTGAASSISDATAGWGSSNNAGVRVAPNPNGGWIVHTPSSTGLSRIFYTSSSSGSSGWTDAGVSFSSLGGSGASITFSEAVNGLDRPIVLASGIRASGNQVSAYWAYQDDVTTWTSYTPTMTGSDWGVTAQIANGYTLGVGRISASGTYRPHVATFPNTVTITDPGNHITAHPIVFTNVNQTGDPFANVSVSTGSTQSVSATGPTHSQNYESLVLIAVATTRDTASTTFFDTWTNSNLTGLTERIDRVVNAGSGGGVGAATGYMAGSGAVGTTTANTATAANWAAWVGVLAAPAPPPDDVPERDAGAVSVTTSPTASGSKSASSDAGGVTLSPLALASGALLRIEAANAVTVSETVAATATGTKLAQTIQVRPTVTPSAEATVTHAANAGAVTLTPTVAGAVSLNNKLTNAGAVTLTETISSAGTTQVIVEADATKTSVTTTPTASATVTHAANAGAVSVTLTPTASAFSSKASAATAVTQTPVTAATATNNKLTNAAAVTVTETITAAQTIDHRGTAATTVAPTPSATGTGTHLAAAGAVTVALTATSAAATNHLTNAGQVTVTSTPIAQATNNKLSATTAVVVGTSTAAADSIDHRGSASTVVSLTPTAASLKTSLAAAALTTVTETALANLLADHLGVAGLTTVTLTDLSGGIVWRTRYLKPDALLVETGLSGPVAYIQDSPTSPDGNALTPTGGAINLRMSFEDPGEQLRQQTGDQIIRVRITAV